MSVYIGRRDVVSASGADAAAYLQGQISQDVDAVAEGASAWSLVLQPQGKVNALFRLTKVAPDQFLLDVDPGHGDAMLARLQRFLLRLDVRFELATWDHHAYRGARPAGIVAPIAAPIDWSGSPGLDVVGPSLSEPADDEHILDDIGYRTLRIEAGVPEMGAEIEESTIPAEAGDVNSWVSFTKGCYTGQELVARIDSRGNNTPRSLHRFRGVAPTPTAGTEVIAAESAVGVLTSVAPTEQGWVALGYLRRNTDGSAVTAPGGEPVTVEPLRVDP